jgi:hypothetical protein
MHLAVCYIEQVLGSDFITTVTRSTSMKDSSTMIANSTNENFMEYQEIKRG